ncbi:MAG: hypothetical protein Q7T11_01200, partial [Deltaproteobacteria bacterium]|nr:hypothetical protein [Deltaproteobacteria bacterium]
LATSRVLYETAHQALTALLASPPERPVDRTAGAVLGARSFTGPLPGMPHSDLGDRIRAAFPAVSREVEDRILKGIIGKTIELALPRLSNWGRIWRWVREKAFELGGPPPPSRPESQIISLTSYRVLLRVFLEAKGVMNEISSRTRMRHMTPSPADLVVSPSIPASLLMSEKFEMDAETTSSLVEQMAWLVLGTATGPFEMMAVVREQSRRGIRVPALPFEPRQSQKIAEVRERLEPSEWVVLAEHVMETLRAGILRAITHLREQGISNEELVQAGLELKWAHMAELLKTSDSGSSSAPQGPAAPDGPLTPAAPQNPPPVLSRGADHLTMGRRRIPSVRDAGSRHHRGVFLPVEARWKRRGLVDPLGSRAQVRGVVRF